MKVWRRWEFENGENERNTCDWLTNVVSKYMIESRCEGMSYIGKEGRK